MRPLHWLIVCFTVALVAAGLMALHTVRHFAHGHLGTQPLKPWMSIPYIARTHHVDREALFEAMGLPPDRHDHRPLWRIARQQGRPVGELIARLQTAITQAHAHHPTGRDRGGP